MCGRFTASRSVHAPCQARARSHSIYVYFFLPLLHFAVELCIPQCLEKTPRFLPPHLGGENIPYPRFSLGRRVNHEKNVEGGVLCGEGGVLFPSGTKSVAIDASRVRRGPKSTLTGLQFSNWCALELILSLPFFEWFDPLGTLQTWLAHASLRRALRCLGQLAILRPSAARMNALVLQGTDDPYPETGFAR